MKHKVHNIIIECHKLIKFLQLWQLRLKDAKSKQLLIILLNMTLSLQRAKNNVKVFFLF